jgi:hypothetical protein
MKTVFIRTSRHDQRGVRFGFYPLLVVAFHFWRPYRGPLGWTLTFGFGRGAGYQWGRTLYFSRGAKGGQRYLYTAAGFRAGFTQNGNETPYSFGS